MTTVHRRKTSWATKFVDRLAGWLITLGGIGTICAVVGVCVFLVWVVLPLFKPARLIPIHFVAQSANESSGGSVAPSGNQTVPFDAKLLAVGLDETMTIIWSVDEDGNLIVQQFADQDVLFKKDLSSHGRPRTLAVDTRSGYIAFGYDQGRIQFTRVHVAVTPAQIEDVPIDIREQVTGKPPYKALSGDGACWFAQFGNIYRLEVRVEEEPDVTVGEAAVDRLAFSLRAEVRNIAALTADGILHIGRTDKKVNFLTGEESVRFTGGALNLQDAGISAIPDFLQISGVADSTYLIWRNGRTLRLDTRDLTNPRIAEEVSLLSPGEGEISAVSFLIGKMTLIVGSTTGTVSAWFPIKPAHAETADGVHLVRAHTYRPGQGAVVALGVSHRSRLFAALFADGTVRVYHATTEQVVTEGCISEVVPVAGQELRDLPATGIALAPKDDGVFAVLGGHPSLWRLVAPHAGVTWKSVFGKVWYEGYEKPAFVWQSSGGTDDFEPKYSLVPLIFGTLKATVFAMLFAVPIAFLAAIYTSEILPREVRSVVKPTIELMAGLPSVVLGFLAALVFAPWVESRLLQVLSLFYVIPFTLLLGGHLTNLCPHSWQQIVRRYRAWFIVLAAGVGAILAQWVGPTAETWLFSGDIKAWLDGRTGRGEPGWVLPLLPLTSLAVGWMVLRVVEPMIEGRRPAISRTAWAALKLALFIVGAVVAVALAWAIGWLLVSGIGLDPRGLFLGTYIQRNAFIVGFVMGFAVIPIIYTIADDALTAVPDHLRAASLGAGATPWQTAIRIVIPTAMSGLFSAFMIGLGRAAGETMIVLMAAGNTPIMDWNIFNGFRTLSANIAVELPEAVQYSTHYRMLFLAALCLFVMTFVINTLAELVRLRFRKKAYHL